MLWCWQTKVTPSSFQQGLKCGSRCWSTALYLKELCQVSSQGAVWWTSLPCHSSRYDQCRWWNVIGQVTVLVMTRKKDVEKKINMSGSLNCQSWVCGVVGLQCCVNMRPKQSYTIQAGLFIGACGFIVKCPCFPATHQHDASMITVEM